MKKILLSFTLIICSLLVVNNVNAQCEAASGLPVPPLTEFDQCTQDISELAIQEYTEPSGGTDDFALAVTYIHPDSTYASNWFAPIQGLSTDGTYDFCGSPLGQYCFHAFSYNQTELDIITNNDLIKGLVDCLEGGEPLEEILECVGGFFGSANIDAAVDSVLRVLVPAIVPEFSADAGMDPPCYDIVPAGMEYCIELTCANDSAMCVMDVAQYFNNTFGVNNSPNPFSAKTFINYTAKINGLVDFKVYNSAGALVYEQKLTSIAGNNSFEFEKGNLEDGVYFYTIGNEQAATPYKMIIK